MKLTTLLLASLTCLTTTHAQYFSEGWQPGQPVPEYAEQPVAELSQRAQEAAASATAPPQSGKATSPFDLSRILESGPVNSLFQRMGVNISKHLEEARLRQEHMWDSRIPLITDDNYEELIVKEELTPEEEEKRVWFIVITAQAGQSSGMSKFIDDNFDIAYNESVIAGDLPDVRWGRIDYFNVTYLTTKWNVWQAPYVMVIRDRGQTLYFYKATQVRLTPEVIREFLQAETWKNSVAWKTPLAPGGEYEKYMHYYALAMTKIYNLVVVLPRWVVMVLSGVVASLAMKLMHRNPEAERPMSREEERKLKARERREKEAQQKHKGQEGKENGKGEGKAVVSAGEVSKGVAESRQGGKKTVEGKGPTPSVSSSPAKGKGKSKKGGKK